MEEPYEKPVVVPAEGDLTLAHHAWADARFATDMGEHALFFALLMPVEGAAAARDIKAGRIMSSIIDPRLADHVRREALKFVDELERCP